MNDHGMAVDTGRVVWCEMIPQKRNERPASDVPHTQSAAECSKDAKQSVRMVFLQGDQTPMIAINEGNP